MDGVERWKARGGREGLGVRGKFGKARRRLYVGVNCSLLVSAVTQELEYGKRPRRLLPGSRGLTIMYSIESFISASGASYEPGVSWSIADSS